MSSEPFSLRDLEDAMSGRHTRRGEPILFACGCRVEFDASDGKEYVVRCGKPFRSDPAKWGDPLPADDRTHCHGPGLQSSERA